MRVMLAGSGGGHVRQLLDLEKVWSSYDYSFVTEETALGRSLTGQHVVDFVDHYAVGQIKLGKPFTFVRSALSNLYKSIAIILKRRPDVIITTGAGAMFWVALAGKVTGSKVILIDSFARFNAPSKFATVTRRFADRIIVQSGKIGKQWPDAYVFDPLKIVDDPIGEKEPLLFATVGATLPFPRLVNVILALKASGRLPERVILQTGEGVSVPDLPGDVEVHETLSFSDVQAILAKADFVVSHGGTGSLITALRNGCRVIAMPRRFTLGEHYDDHQEEITSAFKERGLIETAETLDELEAAIEAWRHRKPVPATTDPRELTDFLMNELSAWNATEKNK